MKRNIMLVFLVIALLLSSTSALAEESVTNGTILSKNDVLVDTDLEYSITLPSALARSYDSGFTLDFSDSAAWILNFDNNAFLMLNHRYVSVTYDSCNPSSSTNAYVKVQLYSDEDEDGTYTLCDGYTFQLKVNDTLKITLPEGNTVMNYRLRFVNLTTSVTSGDFTVTTSRS